MKLVTKTIENDELYLRQISKEVNFEKDDFLNDIKKIKEYCQTQDVLAMACIQIGIPKRIIYLKNTDVHNLEDNSIDESRVLINPIIISKKGKTKYWEACASCLDNMGLVTRPYEIKIQYQDIYNQMHVDTFQGFESTVLSHEYDHLNGILHIDIAEKILVMDKEQRREFRKEHDYEIISKDCKFE